MIGKVLELRWVAYSLLLQCDMLIHVCTIISLQRKNSEIPTNFCNTVFLYD